MIPICIHTGQDCCCRVLARMAQGCFKIKTPQNVVIRHCFNKDTSKAHKTYFHEYSKGLLLSARITHKTDLMWPIKDKLISHLWKAHTKIWHSLFPPHPKKLYSWLLQRSLHTTTPWITLTNWLVLCIDISLASLRYFYLDLHQHQRRDRKYLADSQERTHSSTRMSLGTLTMFNSLVTVCKGKRLGTGEGWQEILHVAF